MSLYDKLTDEQKDRSLRAMGLLRLLASPEIEVVLRHDKIPEDNRLTERGKERVFDALNYLRACFGVDMALVDAYLASNHKTIN